MSVTMNNRHTVCRLDDINDGTARGFELAEGARTLAFFIVRQGAAVFAYQNSCPHSGVNLEWLPDQFLDSSSQYIQCSVHGAMFRIEDGWCVRGPCAGDALMAIPVYLQGDKVVCDFPGEMLASS